MSTTTASPRTAIRNAAYKDKLLEIANQVNAAPGIKDILAILKDRVPDLVGAERVTVFALDVKNQQLYTLMVVGQGLKEIRVPKNFSSIAGFTALSKKTLNIQDAYDSSELAQIHPNLRLDQRWDKKEGFRTKQVLATPILFEKYLMGVLQVINKKAAERFNRDDEAAIIEISRILGVALYNQRRVSRQSQPNKYGYLIDKGIISDKQLREAVTYARMNVRDISSVLIEKFGVPKNELGQSLAQFYKTQFFDWDGSNKIPEDLKNRIPSDFLLKYNCVPVAKEAGSTTFVVEDPFDLSKLDYVKMLGISPNYEFWVGLQEDILACIKSNYQLGDKAGDTMGSILEQLTEMASGEVLEDEEETDQPEEEELDEKDNAIVRLANQIIHEAHKRGASDIHVEPYGPKTPCTIRFRVDGQCHKFMEIPGTHRNALVSRLKIMARLDIAEKQKPQDGKIRFKGPMGELELRVATIPTTNKNEDVVMRLLASSKPLPLDKLGMSDRNLKVLREIVAKPYGIFLCVGPTGSGKTTTLHSCVGSINTPERKIWTVEDPVEITQQGLRQVQINLKKDVTFANSMRAFLRADPDVIMVGEMRDQETAGIGIEASLTGHLVLSTLHTNSAPETITRLLDMDLDPFNFSDALLGILAQRLTRTLCKCKEAYHPDTTEYEELVHLYGTEHWARLGIEYNDTFTLQRAKGCAECNDTGYKGRMGLHELLYATDDAKRLIAKRASIEDIRNQAIRDGMTTLLQDGIWKVLSGHVDLKSVKAVCIK